MEPIKIHISGAEATVIQAPVITAGMVMLPVEFTFGAGWDGLAKNAVYRAGAVSAMEMDIGNTATVDADVMLQKGYMLQIGVYGSRADGTQLPTVWADVGTIQEGVGEAAEKAADPSQPVWAQAVEMLGQIPTLVEQAVEKALATGMYKGDTPKKGVDYWTAEEVKAINDYIDEQMGDVEAALEEIIELQESLIGGGDV